MTFGERVRTIREKKGLSQSDVAKRMHISQQAVAKYEKIVDLPKNSTLCKIADALGVTAYELAGWHERDLAIDFEIDQIINEAVNEDSWDKRSKKIRRIESLLAEQKSIDERSQELKEMNLQLITDTPHNKILSHFDKLNDSGQNKAIEQVELLTKIPEYRKEDTFSQKLELNAAHERTDIEVTEEMKKHDDDIMNDDSEWE